MTDMLSPPRQEESRGLADPEGAKRRRQQKEEAERKAEELEQQGGASDNKLSVSHRASSGRGAPRAALAPQIC